MSIPLKEPRASILVIHPFTTLLVIVAMVIALGGLGTMVAL